MTSECYSQSNRRPAATVTFEEILNQVIHSAQSSKNGLTDGQDTVAYLEIPDFFHALDAHFTKYNVSRKNHLAFQCHNSVLGALTLLYLFKNRYHFVLLPPACQRRDSPESTIPPFCRYVLTVVPPPADDSSALPSRQPENFLGLEENAHYQDIQHSEPSDEGNLYIKTSGSIGSPKMVVHRHSKLLGNSLNCVQRFRLAVEDRITLPVPICHMYGLGAGFLPGVIIGASLDLQDNTNILTYLDREQQFHPTIAFFTPTLCDTVLEKRRSSYPYKLIVTAGDVMKEDVFHRVESRFGRVCTLYGSTELGAIAATNHDGAIESRATTVGTPMPGVRVRLNETSLEPDDNQSPIGELVCQHPYGFEGYVDQNLDSLAIMSPSNWNKTGDLSRIREDGQIEILGRCEQSVNRNGFLVLFTDIERRMETIDGTERVVIVSDGKHKRGQRLVAFCIPRPGCTVTSGQLRTACFNLLPRYAIPDHVSVLSALPTLPNGKVDRQALVTMATGDIQ